MARPLPPPTSLALTTLRRARGLTGLDLARLSGLSKGLVSRYEMGTDLLPSEKLYELASLMGYSRGEVDSLLFGIRAATLRPEPGPLSPVEATPEERRRIREALGPLALAELERMEDAFLKALRDTRAQRDRNAAEDLVRWLLEEPSPKARRDLVETSRQFRQWAVAERLCHESERAAANSADQALDLARLALRVAELAPGDPLWSQRLQGYAWIFIANARRVGGDMPAATEGFVAARQFWEAGASADPGILSAWRLPDREASLRRRDDSNRALALHDEALALAPLEVRGRVLLNKAFTLEQIEESELALPVLLEAQPLLERHEDPRLPWGLQFNLIVILCKLGRFLDAEAAMPEVVELATVLGNELDIVRVLWLRSRIDLGFGRRGEAEAALEQVRLAFRERGIAYDFAKVTLELAVLLGTEGRLSEVKALAQQTLWIFKTQGIHSEAKKALQLFCEAAEAERLTVLLAQRILGYLEKAQRNPALRFEE
jgi:transcriptional regulator with XRE-family HTH domain